LTRVLITGAAGGIGSAAAAELRARGARVVGLDLQPGEDILACDVRDQARSTVRWPRPCGGSAGSTC
jgi:nucleoside-diphosphate-sugar epimerase